MGDLSEMRGLVTVFTFLSVFVLLFSMVPSQFTAATTMSNTTQPTEVWHATEFSLGQYNETWGHYANETGGYTDGDWYKILDVGTGDPVKFGGHDIDFWHGLANSSNHQIVWRHNSASGGLIPIYSGHYMTWTNLNDQDRGLSLELTDLESDYADNLLPYTVSCSHFFMFCDFYYNETTYATLTDAFDHNELYVIIGINFDQMGASYDAFSIIGKLVTFQPLDILYPFNYILGAVLWACIAYIAFIFILRVVGAVFGGGGA